MEIEVGCVVSYAIGKSGVVRFVGETEFAAGEWVGIELDRPDGKNNGELNGKVYFRCPPNHGLFCKKAQVCNSSMYMYMASVYRLYVVITGLSVRWCIDVVIVALRVD